MPFRLEKQGFPGRCKVQFTTGSWMPSMIYRACLTTGVRSNTVYIQRAVVAALARDLGLDEQDLLARLPKAMNSSAHLFDPDEHTMSRYGVPIPEIGRKVMAGPAQTIEEVR